MDLTTIRAAKNGNEASIKQVMEKYSPLIKKVKHKYHAKGYAPEDFESIAMFGVWRGIQEFKETKCKFYYNKKTKTWRVDEITFQKMLSTSIKNQVLRYIARVWRGEEKDIRKGTETELKANSPLIVDKQCNATRTTIALNEMVEKFNPFQQEIAKHLLAKETRKDIAKLVGCSKSVLRKEITAMAELLSAQGYFFSSHTY